MAYVGRNNTGHPDIWAWRIENRVFAYASAAAIVFVGRKSLDFYFALAKQLLAEDQQCNPTTD